MIKKLKNNIEFIKKRYCGEDKNSNIICENSIPYKIQKDFLLKNLNMKTGITTRSNKIVLLNMPCRPDREIHILKISKAFILLY